MGIPIPELNFSEINISAVLSKYVYANDQDEDYNYEGITIQEVIKKSKENGRKLGADEDLQKAIDEYGLRGLELIKQSSTSHMTKDGDGNYKMEELISCAFKDKDGNIYIVYRGTGDGKWVDNGEAFAAESTIMQQRAAQFYDDVIKQMGFDKEKRGRVIVTGHSKGGNMAQFVTMDSKYGELVDNCYSIDGQGFSEKAIEAFKKKWGDDYQKQIDKMYSINGYQDYVHDLGNVIIDKDKTYFIKTNGEGFEEWHSLDCFFDENGKILWDENERKRFSIEQGPVGRLAAEVSKRMMALEEEQIEDCSITIMSILEFFLGDKLVDGTVLNSRVGTGNRKTADLEEWAGFLSVGLPLIFDILGTSEELPEILRLLGFEEYVILVEEIQKFVKENNINLGQYIFEDPMRLIKIYASLDLSKKEINELIIKVCGITGLASFLIKFIPVVGPVVNFVGTVVTALTAIALIANHIIKNWDNLVQNIKQAIEYLGDRISDVAEFIGTKIVEGYEYVTDKLEQAYDFVSEKVSEFYNGLKKALHKGLNLAVGKVYEVAENVITKGGRIFNKAYDMLCMAGKVSMSIIQNFLKYSNPILYLIASGLYGLRHEKVSVDLKKLKRCVNTLHRLATKISSLDSRLDTLYYKLSQNNIEQQEGVFTSLANMYNLFSADIKIDEGASIKRRARELGELVEDFEGCEKKIIRGVPRAI